MIRPENRAKANQAAELIDTVLGAMGQLGELRAAGAALTASATVEHGRITVTVDATGSIVHTSYHAGIEELSYGQIARATVRAAQQAARKVKSKQAGLFAPMAALAVLPEAGELPPELAELRAQMPQPISAPLTRPARRTADDDGRAPIVGR